MRLPTTSSARPSVSSLRGRGAGRPAYRGSPSVGGRAEAARAMTRRRRLRHWRASDSALLYYCARPVRCEFLFNFKYGSGRARTSHYTVNVCEPNGRANRIVNNRIDRHSPLTVDYGGHFPALRYLDESMSSMKTYRSASLQRFYAVQLV